jgi:signal transduction histidine kinase
VRITSVRARLALWNVGVLALVLAVFGAALRQIYEAKLMGAVDRELIHRARFFAGRRGGPGPPPGPPPSFPLDIIGRSGPPPGGPGPGERGPFGRGLDGPRPDGVRPGEPDGPRSGGPPPPPFMMGTFRPRLLGLPGRSLATETDPEPWDASVLPLAAQGEAVFSFAVGLDQPLRVLSIPVIQDGQVAGVAQFPFPLTDIHEELGRLTRTLLTLVPPALLMAALGGVFLTGRALQPVRRVTRAAAQIGARASTETGQEDGTIPLDDLSERLPVKGNDEFSELAATFNGMLGRLELAFRQREQALEQLAQALERQQRFTGDASHELRTPLTIIKANTSLALEEERSAEEYRRTLESVDRAADATIRIVQDLLLLARGDAGQLARDRRPIPIADVLERAAEPFRSGSGPSILVEISDPSLTVSGDAHDLHRLFCNLLENAVRHTPPAGRITLSAAAEGDEGVVPSGGTSSQGTRARHWSEGAVGPASGRAGGEVVVEVRDTGEGIAPEHLPRVCERFYRVDAARTRRQGGTGLGLAICQTIVDAHDGTLSLDSVLGQGTTVTVRLPERGAS